MPHENMPEGGRQVTSADRDDNVPLVPTPRKKKRRWGRRLFLTTTFLLLLIGGLIALAPTWVSSKSGTSSVLGFVNQQLRGTLAVDSLAVSWTSPTEIRGLRVLDPDKREVLAVSEIRHAAGLLQLIQSGMNFGEVIIDSPVVTVNMNAANELSISRAFEMRNPSAPTTTESLIPDVRGKLVVKNARIDAARDTGETYSVSALNFDATFDTLGDIKSNIVLTFADGTQLSGDAAVRQLVAGGRLTPGSIAGTINIATSGAIDLGPLTRFLSPEAAVDGTLALNVKSSTDAGKIQADFTIDVVKLRAAGGGGTAIAPIDLRIAGKAARDGDRLHTAANLSGEAGALDVALSYNTAGVTAELTSERLLNAIFGGQSLALPECTLDAKGSLDLAKLGRAIPGVLKLQPGKEITGGRLTIEKLTAGGGANPTASAAIQISDLTAVSAGQTARIQPISLALDAQLTPGKGLELSRADLKASFVDLSAHGTAAELQTTLRGSLTKMRDELGQVFDLSAVMLGGDFSGDARLGCGGAGKPIVTGGRLALSNVSYDGKAVLDSDANVVWKDLQIAADGSTLAAGEARVESSAASIHANGFKLRTSPALEMSADVVLGSDLSKLFRAVGVLSGMEKPPAIAGTLSMGARVSTAGDEVAFTGKGGIDNLVAGEGADAVRDARLNIELDGRIDNKKDLLNLTRANIVSTPLTLEIGGTVSQLRSSQTLALKGRYDASWQQVTKLLHELVPSTADLIVVRGPSRSTFEITGPVSTPGAMPPFKGLSTALDVGWESADLAGAMLKSASLRPTLQAGVLTLPIRAIPTADGNVNLGGSLDFTSADPTLRMPGTTKLLESVAVTPQLAHSLLSRINPIFTGLVRVEGKVNLHLTDILFPLGDSMKTLAAGKGFLDLGSLKIQPAGFFGVLVDVLGQTQQQEMIFVQFGKCDFLMKDGRLRYDNFTMVFPENVDLVFRGSIGLDDTLDLWVSLPVREALLKRLGVKEPALTYARKLGGLRIELPIAGTRTNPQLDFSKVDVPKLVQEILLKGGAEKGVEEGLGNLLKGLEGDKKAESAKPDKPAPRDRKKDRDKP